MLRRDDDSEAHCEQRFEALCATGEGRHEKRGEGGLRQKVIARANTTGSYARKGGREREVRAVNGYVANG